VKDFLTKNPTAGKANGSHFSVEYPDGIKTEPDLSVIPRQASAPKASVFHGTPLLIVEVLSLSTREHDLTNKKAWAMDNYVPEVWFVDPESREIICFVLKKETGAYSQQKITQGTLVSHTLPGFSLDISSAKSLPEKLT
jgi:Uma2 family endonuclease